MPSQWCILHMCRGRSFVACFFSVAESLSDIRIVRVYLNDWRKKFKSKWSKKKEKLPTTTTTRRKRTERVQRETNHVNNIKLCSRNEYVSCFTLPFCISSSLPPSFSRSVSLCCTSSYYSHSIHFNRCVALCILILMLHMFWSGFASDVGL